MLFLCLAFPVQAQESFRVVFWNVENLFDCKDDPHKNDNEFLPDSKRNWTPFRYWQKVRNLAKGIIASGNDYVPDLVGLCEVENDSCLYDLTRRSPLREAGYRFVMTDSPDQRGIDVALLYQRAKFKLLQHQSIRIPHKQLNRGATRDILHVIGQVVSGDTLDVMVCHFPSRSGGQAESEPYRIFVAETLKHYVDSLLEVRSQPYIIVMGDFNDVPSAAQFDMLDNILVNKSDSLHAAGRGTIRYEGKWDLIDMFLVSSNIEGHSVMDIPEVPFLMTRESRHAGEKPLRTYSGPRYLGGVSDHLPVVLYFRN